MKQRIIDTLKRALAISPLQAFCVAMAIVTAVLATQAKYPFLLFWMVPIWGVLAMLVGRMAKLTPAAAAKKRPGQRRATQKAKLATETA